MAFYPNVARHPTLPASAAGYLTGGHWIVIQAVKRIEYTVSVLLDTDGMKLSQHGAQWEEIKRPRGTAITEWQGRQNFHADLAIVFDGFRRSTPIGHYVRLVEDMAEYGLVIRLVGPGVKLERHWVIADLSYGDQIRAPDGNRLRQHMVLGLYEYVPGEELERLPKGKAQATGSLLKFRQHRVGIGDDLQKIALRTLGSAARWPDIQKLNEGMRGVKLDPDLYPPGSRVWIPSD